jgi:hypothetical protein
MALWPNSYEGEVAQVPVLMGRPMQGSHRINNVDIRILMNPRTEMVVVHLDRLTPYQGTGRDERP